MSGSLQRSRWLNVMVNGKRNGEWKFTKVFDVELKPRYHLTSLKYSLRALFRIRTLFGFGLKTFPTTQT